MSALRDLDVISNELNRRLDLEPGAEAASPVAGAAPEGESHPHPETQDEPESSTLMEARTAQRD